MNSVSDKRFPDSFCTMIVKGCHRHETLSQVYGFLQNLTDPSGESVQVKVMEFGVKHIVVHRFMPINGIEVTEVSQSDGMVCCMIFEILHHKAYCFLNVVAVLYLLGKTVTLLLAAK